MVNTLLYLDYNVVCKRISAYNIPRTESFVNTGIKEAGKFLTNQTDKTGTTYNGNYDYRPSTAEPYVYNFTP